MLNISEKHEAVVGQPVNASEVNSKRYFVKTEKPLDDEGKIGDICFVFNLEKPEPPEPEVLPPFELITGYTIDHDGPNQDSAKLVGGTVTFTGVTSLSLNNVFSSEYRNYVIVIRGNPDSSPGNIGLRMRASGAGPDSGSDSEKNYTRQYLQAVDKAVNADRRIQQTEATIGSFGDTSLPSGQHVHIYGPYLPEPTAIRSVNVLAGSGVPNITDNANTHSLPRSYDGCEILPLTASTGTLSVYGVRS